MPSIRYLLCDSLNFLMWASVTSRFLPPNEYQNWATMGSAAAGPAYATHINPSTTASIRLMTCLLWNGWTEMRSRSRPR